MLRKILPVVLVIVGVGAGVGAGLALRPVPEPKPEDPAHTAPMAEEKPPELEYVKIPSQFVVPLMEAGRVGSLVVLTLSLEVQAGQADSVYAREPKLRDEFLRVMFDHANTGGFRGTFTESANMTVLRRALLESARKVLGDTAHDVLITDIVRQDS